MVKLTIDGKTIEALEGTTVLRAAEAAGIEIPKLCDFEHLKPYGGCRLCVVEVEGARTLQPSCTLPVSNNMVVYTNTPKVRDARKFVLTLLFSERNHFCMYCQVTGGDCELQNAALNEGMTHWQLQPNWEPYPVDASHPHFIFDHNRCILCRRCVRACGDLVGNFTLGAEERGAKTMIIADYNVPMGESSCIACGTCTQVCPTGALINRYSAYRGPMTKADVVESICIGCSVGCGVELLVRDNNLARIDGNWEAAVNGGVLCEDGRFKPMDEKRQRVLTPMVRKDGALKAATWEEALSVIAGKFKPLAGKNGSGIAALASTRLPAEALSAFKGLFADGMGSPMVTGIEEDFTSVSSTEFAADYPRATFDDLKTADCVLVIGADLKHNHQVAGFFVKRNLPQGTKLLVIDPNENGFEKIALHSLKPKKGSDYEALMGLAAAIENLEMAKSAAGIPLTESPASAAQACGINAETLLSAARVLGMAQSPVIVYGRGVTAHKGQTLKALIALAKVSGAKLLNLKGRANSLAAHAYELDKAFIPAGRQAAFVALGDDHLSQRMTQEIEKVPFKVVQASYVSPATAMADVVLPVTMWSEQGGHYLNLEGRLQTAQAAVTAPEGVRSNLQSLQALADALGVTLPTDWETALQPFAI